MILSLTSGRAKTHTHVPLTPDSGYLTTSPLWSTLKCVLITHKEANGLISRNPVSGLLRGFCIMGILYGAKSVSYKK